MVEKNSGSHKTLNGQKKSMSSGGLGWFLFCSSRALTETNVQAEI